jgi:hypothetical protein
VLAAAFSKKSTSTPQRIVLNFGAVVLATYAAAGGFALAGGAAGAPAARLVLPLGAAAAAYFLCNTAIVAVAVALETRRGALATWRAMAWNVWSSAGGMAIALLSLSALEHSLGWGLALAALPCGLLLCSYRVEARAGGAKASLAATHGASRSAMASAATAAPAEFQCGSSSKHVGNTPASRNVSSSEWIG